MGKEGYYDFETAKVMLEAGRHFYVLFCCQQALEKMLKALISKNTKEFPPRRHQLMRLVELTGIEPTEEQAEFLRELSSYYIQSRYPAEIGDVDSQVSDDMAGGILE